MEVHRFETKPPPLKTPPAGSQISVVWPHAISCYYYRRGQAVNYVSGFCRAILFWGRSSSPQCGALSCWRVKSRRAFVAYLCLASCRGHNMHCLFRAPVRSMQSFVIVCRVLRFVSAIPRAY